MFSVFRGVPPEARSASRFFLAFGAVQCVRSLLHLWADTSLTVGRWTELIAGILWIFGGLAIARATPAARPQVVLILWVLTQVAFVVLVASVHAHVADDPTTAMLSPPLRVRAALFLGAGTLLLAWIFRSFRRSLRDARAG